MVAQYNTITDDMIYYKYIYIYMFAYLSLCSLIDAISGTMRN